MVIDVRPLFGPLDEALQTLLDRLEPADWTAPVSAGSWCVRDVVCHLLDGNLRALSVQRDLYAGELPPDNAGYSEMVEWLNRLNADWIRATRRLSPDVLKWLHRQSGPEVTRYYSSLELHEPAIFAVAWAGEIQSQNWMHLGREYTEKWHHQQQIRETVNDQCLLDEPFFHPYLQVSMLGLPHLYRDIDCKPGTSMAVHISGIREYYFTLIRKPERWVLENGMPSAPASQVKLPAEIAWKLFSGNLKHDDPNRYAEINGDESLGKKMMELVAVMA